MKSISTLAVLGGAYALSSDKLDLFAPQTLLHDKCPPNSELVEGECQLSMLATSGTTFDIQVSFRSNISQTTLSLEEARKLAEETEDFPWGFWPECFSVDEDDDPFCVFSQPTFAHGRGIFIMTTRPFAYAMLQKEGFKDPSIHYNTNQYKNPPFVEYEFPGKGRGIVANKTLHRGAQIFASTPIILTDPDAFDLATPERLALLHRGVETLPPATREAFWRLMGHSGSDPADDRINTNNFDVSIDGVSQSALFPEIAMMNHDCRPNAAYFFDEETMTQYVHAIREIQPGEEITITYIDNEREREKRVRHLHRNWGFDCGCALCTANHNLVHESDSRLVEIASLIRQLNDWTQASKATPEMADLLISLYQQERLDANLAVAYKHAAEVHSSFGHKFEAMRFARLSTEYSQLDKGFRDADVEQMKKMASDPQMTWSWNKRIGMKSGCGCGGKH